MAAPSYATDLTDINLAESTSGWAALGGGASGLSVEPDFTIQGSNCIAKQIKSETKGHHYNNGSTSQGADDHVFVWLYVSTPGTTDSLTNGGLRVTIGTSGTARKEFYVAGNDTYAKGGWFCYPVRYSLTADNAVGSAGATPSYFGSVMNGTVSVKSPNLGVDAIRYGSNVSMTNGEALNEATFVGAAQYADNTTRSWGLIQEISGGASIQGKVLIGTSGTSCVFEESGILVTFVNNNPSAVNQHTLADFKSIIIDNSSTTVVWAGITFLSLDTTDKGDIIVTTSSSSDWTGCTFQSINISTLHSSVTANVCKWKTAGQITQNSATLTSCAIEDNIATAAIIVDDLDIVTDCTFISDGTGHAVDLGTISSTHSVAWDNTDTGYAATDGSTGNETIVVSVNTGITLTINVGSGYSTPTIKNDGVGDVVVVSGTVTLTVKVIDESASDVQNANVLLRASDGTGPFPYKESVTITRSGTTATVTHTGHGMATGDKVQIKGATDHLYNKIAVISVTDVNTYTYTMSGTPAASPASGTILATFVALEGLSSATGIVTVSRAYSADQPITGWARKSTTSPYYKQATITTDVTSSSGLSSVALLILDE